MRNINNPVDKNRPTKKLTNRFARLYTITQVISSTAYKLELPNTMKIHLVFHISLLKLYQPSPADFERPTPPLAIIIPETDHEEYEVEAILDKRMLRNKPQYLVKWLGYPLYDATWEPIGNLENAKEAIQKFEAMRTLQS